MRTWRLASISAILLASATSAPAQQNPSEVSSTLWSMPAREEQAAEPDSSIPPRSEDAANGLSFAALSNFELWDRIATLDRTAVIGLKAPHRRRGVYKGRVLVDAAQWQRAQEAVLAHAGVTLLRADTERPVITVKLEDLKTLREVRSLPVVDYLEPPFVAKHLASSGCEIEIWGRPFLKPIPFTLEQMTLPSTLEGIIPHDFLPEFNEDKLHDIMPWNYKDHEIPQAWARGATGHGITVAVIDTGVYDDQTQLSSQPTFSDPMKPSKGRYLLEPPYEFSSSATCSHGTRMAGTIAAPYDNQNIVGVAWGANLLSLNSLDDVWMNWNEERKIINAIRTAVDFGAKIIVMAFGDGAGSYVDLEEEINLHYRDNNVLFFAGAGTEPACPKFPAIVGVKIPGVFLPARYENVIAVTGLAKDGGIHYSACYGQQVDIAATIGEVPAPGRTPGDVAHFGGSSDATAVTAGIAALVWSEHPDWNRDAVRERLFSSTGQNRNSESGWGKVNAYRAVGGFYGLSITGPTAVDAHQPYTLTAKPLGDGPFTYRWLPGGETSASIAKVAGNPRVRHSWTVEVTDTVEKKTLSQSHNVTVKVPPNPGGDSPLCPHRPWLCN